MIPQRYFSRTKIDTKQHNSTIQLQNFDTQHHLKELASRAKKFYCGTIKDIRKHTVEIADTDARTISGKYYLRRCKNSSIGISKYKLTKYFSWDESADRERFLIQLNIICIAGGSQIEIDERTTAIFSNRSRRRVSAYCQIEGLAENVATSRIIRSVYLTAALRRNGWILADGQISPG